MIAQENATVVHTNRTSFESSQRGLLDFLTFVSLVGADGLKKGTLLSDDRSAVNQGLEILAENAPRLLRLLTRTVDEREPNFEDLVFIQSLWSLLGGVFLIGQHAGVTRSAKAFLSSEQTQPARAAKISVDAEKARKQKEALQSVLGIKDFSKPYKLADSIFDFPREEAKLRRAAKRLGIKPFSKSTAERLLVQMRDQPDNETFIPDSNEGSFRHS